MDWDVFRAYVDHFLPREVIGPVVIVFSLESVVSGLFELYVPAEYALVGWAIIFLISVVVVAYWGAADEEAVEDLQERLEEIQEEEKEGSQKEGTEKEGTEKEGTEKEESEKEEPEKRDGR